MVSTDSIKIQKNTENFIVVASHNIDTKKIATKKHRLNLKISMKYQQF